MEIVGGVGGDSGAQVFVVIKRPLRLVQTSCSQFILLLSTAFSSCSELDQIKLLFPSRA